jgi:hypothetical protein
VHAVGQQSTKEGCCMATDKHATVEETVVFYWSVPRQQLLAAQQCQGSVSYVVRPRWEGLCLFDVKKAAGVPGVIAGYPLSGGYKYGEIECWLGPAANLLY